MANALGQSAIRFQDYALDMANQREHESISTKEGEFKYRSTYWAEVMTACVRYHV